MTPPNGTHQEPSTRERLARLEVKVASVEEENSGQTKRIEVIDAKVDSLRLSMGRIESIGGVVLKLLIAVAGSVVVSALSLLWRAIRASL